MSYNLTYEVEDIGEWFGAEKDRAALVARIATLRNVVNALSAIVEFNVSYSPFPPMEYARAISTTLDQEYADWIAQRGIEAVKEAVL